jgi:hypothetical protein
MAKKTSDELFQAFLADVMATVPTDQRDTVEKVLKDERVSAKMKEGVLARSDYSRMMDEGRTELNSARQQFDGEVAEARARIAGWEEWYGTASKQVADSTGKLKQYRERFGELDGTAAPKEKSLSEEEFQRKLTEELQKHDIAAITFATDLTSVQIEHLKEFKETLDPNKLIETATKRGIGIKQAYQELVAPKIREREEKRFQDAVAAAKEEGRREAVSNHRLPFSGPTEPHVLDSINRSDTPRTEGDRVAAATKRWLELRSQAH